MAIENGPEDEALRLKNLAEEKYSAGNLKSALKYAKRAQRRHPSLDGISEMITAFEILRTASEPIFSTSSDGGGVGSSTESDYYKILQVERFVHINIIKKQYKKLALVLHPDKNPFSASEEAFKHVGEAFRVLSDKIRRKEYDMKVRIAMQDEAADGIGEAVETFWTLCSTCRLLHKFERKYLGHNLVCPSCRKSFKAVEVDEGKTSEEVNKWAEVDETLEMRVSERIRARRGVKAGSVLDEFGNMQGKGKGSEKVEMEISSDTAAEEVRRPCGRKEHIDRLISKRAKVGDDEEKMTLAEMWMLVRKKGDEEKTGLKGKGKRKEIAMLLEAEKDNGSEKLLEMENEEEEQMFFEMDNGEEDETLLVMKKQQEEKMIKDRDKEKLKENEKDIGSEKVEEREKRESHGTSKSRGIEIVYTRARKDKRRAEIQKGIIPRQHSFEVALLEQPSFYNFDKDRQEKSFKKGQVWAAYEYNGGMPRNYALVDEIVSWNPFEVRFWWLEFQSNGDEQSFNLEKRLPVPCGKYKVSKYTSVKSRKMFSHVADSERIARELYWVYPRKGSVWALYSQNMMACDAKYRYSIVVLLTTYTDQYGMSVAYLVKVDGFRTVYKRWEVGAGAPLLLDKDDFRLFSHQIPAKKLSGDEATGLTGDCWELDPSALPPEPHALGLGR